MYEYMNTSFILVAGILLFFLLLAAILQAGKNQEKGEKSPGGYAFLILATILVVVIPIWDALDMQKSVLKNKRLFNNNQVIRCSTLTTSYLVSKSKGWHFLDKNSLTDGNIILNIKMCKE